MCKRFMNLLNFEVFLFETYCTKCKTQRFLVKCGSSLDPKQLHPHSEYLSSNSKLCFVINWEKYTERIIHRDQERFILGMQAGSVVYNQAMQIYYLNRLKKKIHIYINLHWKSNKQNSIPIQDKNSQKKNWK